MQLSTAGHTRCVLQTRRAGGGNPPQNDLPDRLFQNSELSVCKWRLIYGPRAEAGTGSAPTGPPPAVSPAPYPYLSGLREWPAQPAASTAAARAGSRPATRDAPRMRKSRRAARPDCNGARRSTRSSTAVATGFIRGHRAPATTNNRFTRQNGWEAHRHGISAVLHCGCAARWCLRVRGAVWFCSWGAVGIVIATFTTLLPL
jgi:hypothetical protein